MKILIANKKLMSKLTAFLGSTAAVAALSVSMTTTAAAWTFTTTGTISSGYDYTGVFGANDLTGMSFSNSITLDPAAYVGYSYTVADESYSAGTLTGTATNTVTVGNATRTFTWDWSNYPNGGIGLLAAYLTNGTGNYDQAYQNQNGYTADGSSMEYLGYLYSFSNAFGLSTSFNQSWAYTAQAGDVGYSYFQIYGNSDYANFHGTISTISINNSINAAPVPEPETYAMLLAGLGLLSFTAKRRKQSA